MICRRHNRPHAGQDIDATVCWMTEQTSLRAGTRFLLKHTTRNVKAIVRDLQYRLDVNTLHRDEAATELGLNQIGRVTLRTSVPIIYDEFRRNRTTGSLIVVDEDTNETVGGGMHKFVVLQVDAYVRNATFCIEK